MKRMLTGIALSAMTLALAPAFAADQAGKDAYNATKARAESDYKTASAQCDALAGNAKDVCVKEAKLQRTRTEANARAAYENTPKARSKAARDIADAEYDLAKEKCDDQAGNAKDVCVKEAKAAREKASANAKARQKSGEARADAAEARTDADYQVAREKCDSLAGAAKDDCVAAAKQQYGK